MCVCVCVCACERDEESDRQIEVLAHPRLSKEVIIEAYEWHALFISTRCQKHWVQTLRSQLVHMWSRIQITLSESFGWD